MPGERIKARRGKNVIVASALENFRRLGFHGTSMRDVARSADVTVAAIYHHFPSKQEMLQQIMVESLRDVLALTRAALLDAGSVPSRQLSALVYAWIEFHTTRQSEALIGATELRSLDAAGHRLVTALRDEQERMFLDVIERGVAQGAFATRYPREATRAVLEMGYSVSGWYRSSGELSPADMAERYVDLALGAVRALPEE